MNHADQLIMGHAGGAAKAPGHWVLARLGKKVLRPGGLELTERMLSSLNVGGDDDVVEFAPGLGATARMTLRRNPRSYAAVERDERAAETVRMLLSGKRQRCIVGRAEDTGLASQSATVVYGEAMLTMQSTKIKERIVTEAARLLVPGGRYGIHEIALSPDTLPAELSEQISHELSTSIHHAVRPITVDAWRRLLHAHSFHVTAMHTAPMHLLEPRRLLADEGTLGAIRFAWNMARDRESRRRVMQMRHVFKKYREHLSAVVLVAVRD